MPLRVLNIEDNPADADLLLETLELEGKADRLDVVWEKRLQTGLRRLDTDLFDAVLLDLNLPDGSGVEVISRVRSVAPDIPLLVMTGIDDEELALQAVQAGAQDYLLKGQINAALLERSIRYAIERKRSETALQRRAREMEALYQTSLEINAELEVQSVLYSIVERAVHLTNMKLGGLYLLEPDGETLRLEVEHQISGSYLGARLKLGQGASGQAAQTGEPLVVNDYRTWEHRVSVFGEQEFRRIIAVPLKARGKVIGVINLGDDQVQAPVSAEEMRLLRLFADQAAIVLEKVRLLEAERAKAQELQRSNQLIAALGLVAGRLQANLDADQLMSALGAELLQMGIYLLIAHHQTEQGFMSVRYTSIDTLALAEAERMLQRTIRGLHSGDPIDHSVDRMGDRRPSFTQNLLPMFDPLFAGVPQDQVRQALRLIDIQENSAAISLPLVVKDRAFGSLVVWGKTLRETDIPAFSVFSNHVAAALENARLYNEIQKLAIMDELTGLYNRRGFFALAQQNLQLAQRVKKGVLLIFADIDGMKEINDTLGHQTGDQALVDAAGILRVTYRSADIIARVGGDEFAILAVLSTRPDEAALSERLAENLEAFNAANDRPYVLSLSTGMSAWPAGKALELDKLLAEADVRMYANKRAKKGTG